MRELACLAFSDISEVFDFAGDAIRFWKPKDIPPHAHRAIQSLKVRRYLERTGTLPDGTPVFEICEVVEFKLHPKGRAR